MLRTSGIDDLAAWRIRPSMDDSYKLENISNDASDCLGSTYIGFGGNVSATYNIALTYATQEKINLS